MLDQILPSPGSWPWADPADWVSHMYTLQKCRLLQFLSFARPLPLKTRWSYRWSYSKIHSFGCSIQELRDIAATKAVKGKPFFLEVDIKGPGLKLDNMGKAILTVSVYNFSYLLWQSIEHVAKWYFFFIIYITEDD